ncbi:hypothetical protein D3C86_1741010 [compost metagenome]
MYFIPGTPLIARSRGIRTDLTINSPFAPGYSAVIFTLGGEMEGNCVMGSLSIDNTPRNTMIKEMTMDRTGL